MKLQYKIDDSIIIDNKKYTVNASFNIILKLFDLLEDTRLSTNERVNLGLKLLIGDNLQNFFNMEDKLEILKNILEEYIQLNEKEKYDILGNPMPKMKNEKLLDYTVDAELIYSAFMQVYGIDLIEEQNKLHWSKFQALLNNLPDGTKLGQVISFRAWNESDDNKDYKQFMREQKQNWKLE